MSDDAHKCQLGSDVKYQVTITLGGWAGVPGDIDTHVDVSRFGPCACGDMHGETVALITTGPIEVPPMFDFPASMVTLASLFFEANAVLARDFREGRMRTSTYGGNTPLPNHESAQ